MSWKLLAEYDKLISGLSKTDPFYSEKSFHILESLRQRNNLGMYEFTKFCNVITTRNRFRNKEILNESERKLKEILNTNSYDDICEFNKIYYECLDRGSTARVTDYIEKTLVCQNYHYELCHKCNPSFDTSLPNISVPEASPKALKAMFCLYSMMAQHKRFGFLYVDTISAFLPAEDSNARCNIGDIPPNIIFQKVKQILTKKMGYSVVKGNSVLFSHHEYGLALVSNWEILFYSSTMNIVKDLLSDYFLWSYCTNHFNFMGYQIDMDRYMLTTSWYDYVDEKFSEMFTNAGLNYIHNAASYPCGDYFGYLEDPPYGDPRQINDAFIRDEINYGGLVLPYNLHITQNELQGCGRMVGLLNYVVLNFRWDLKYYLSVLSRYTRTPNVILYLAIMDVFRYIYSTRNFMTMYKPLPKNAPMIVNIFTSGIFKDHNPTCSYSGYIINIGKRYWHSKSKRIRNIVDEPFVSDLCAAYDAVECVVLNQGTLKILEQHSNNRIEYCLNIENGFLFNVLVHDTECVLTSSWRKRLNALKTWLSEYYISVRVVRKSQNPASVLTRDSNAAREYLFEQSQYVKYAYEGYEDPSDEYDEFGNGYEDPEDAYDNYSGNIGWGGSRQSYW